MSSAEAGGKAHLPNGAFALRRFCPLRPTAQARHLGIDGGLVDEDQAARFASHPGLPAIDPDPAPLGNISACAFRGHQLFFYM